MHPAYDPRSYAEDRVFGAPGLLGWLTGRRKAAVVKLIMDEIGNASEKSILDIGCGYGEMLADVDAKWKTGVDINQDALREAARNNPGALFSVADVEKLPFPDATFDAVICSEVLEHMDDPHPLAREIIRVTKPGGIYCVTVPNERVTTFGRWMLGKHPAKSPAHKQDFSPSSVANLFPAPPLQQRLVPFGFLPFALSTNVVSLFRNPQK